MILSHYMTPLVNFQFVVSLCAQICLAAAKGGQFRLLYQFSPTWCVCMWVFPAGWRRKENIHSESQRRKNFIRQGSEKLSKSKQFSYLWAANKRWNFWSKCDKNSVVFFPTTLPVFQGLRKKEPLRKTTQIPLLCSSKQSNNGNGSAKCYFTMPEIGKKMLYL